MQLPPANVQASQVTEPGLFGYEDIEPPAKCILRGHSGVIGDKGEYILENTKGRHIHVFYTSDEKAGEDAMVHENLVNKYLKEKRKLWVDFHGDDN